MLGRSDLESMCIEGGLIGIPMPSPLPGDDKPIGYYIIGDDAFGMKT